MDFPTLNLWPHKDLNDTHKCEVACFTWRGSRYDHFLNIKSVQHFWTDAQGHIHRYFVIHPLLTLLITATQIKFVVLNAERQHIMYTPSPSKFHDVFRPNFLYCKYIRITYTYTNTFTYYILMSEWLQSINLQPNLKKKLCKHFNCTSYGHVTGNKYHILYIQ